jgi:nucleotide-binding universal stress UspA family protein
MKLIESILFPVDFSPRCDATAVHVEALAVRFHARLILLHAVEVPFALIGSRDFAPPGDFIAAHVRNARSRLNSYLAADLKQVGAERLVVESDAAQAVLKHASANNVSLIMMPTHGLGPFRRYLLGSVTAKVLHDAPCPVWTSAHIEDAPQPDKPAFDRIVCAVDFGPASERTLRWASQLAVEYDARLLLVHAGQPEHASPKAAELLEKTGAAAGIRIQPGEPAKVVGAIAEQEKANLLVIARGGAGAGGGLRSHAYAIVRNAPCPVVSV